MQTRLLKELRLLLPAWLLIVAVTLIPALLPGWHPSEFPVFCLVLGCPLIAACSFGPEFTQGTISQLLSQPIDRRRIWFEKMLVLGALLLPLWVGALLLYRLGVPKAVYWLLVIGPICAFCAAPFFTFVARNVIGTVVLSLAVPFLIYLGAGALILWLFKSGTIENPSESREWIDEQALHRWIFIYFAIALPVYCAALYYFGYRWFRRLEVADLLERQIRLANSLHHPIERLLNRLFTGKLRHIASLAAKELHIQQNAITVWLIFTVLQIAAVIYIDVGHPESPETWFTAPLGIYFMLMPLVIGASAFAEEQKLGVRAWHLALPVSFRTQWLIKATIAFLFALVLGLIVPFLWVVSAPYLSPSLPPLSKELFTGTLWPQTSFAVSVVLAVTAIGFYVSSFSRDTLRAIVGTAGLLVAFGFILPFIAKVAHVWLPPSPRLIDAVFRTFPGAAYSSVRTHIGMLAGGGVLFWFFATALWGSFRHFKILSHNLRGLWIITIFGYIPGLVLFLAFAYLTAILVNYPAVR